MSQADHTSASMADNFNLFLPH